MVSSDILSHHIDTLACWDYCKIIIHLHSLNSFLLSRIQNVQFSQCTQETML